MATIISHASAAVAVGLVYPSETKSRAFWDYVVLCSILPDADVVGFVLGVQYGDFLGHRGFTHSLTFAALLGLAVAYFIFPEERTPTRRFWKLAGFFAFVTATHGLLDTITDGGMGVALFSPFNLNRYFAPWTPVFVSPIGLREFLDDHGAVVFISKSRHIWLPFISYRGAMLLISELEYIWLPFWSVAGAVLLWRRFRKPAGSA